MGSAGLAADSGSQKEVGPTAADGALVYIREELFCAVTH